MIGSTARASRSDVLGRVGAFLLIALLSAVLGNGLARAATALDDVGPTVMIALPALLILAVASFDRPLIGIAGIVLTFPFGAIALPTGPVSLQVVEVAVVVVAGVVCLHRLSRGTTLLPWTPHMWWVLALIGWTLVALPSALDQELALKQIAQLVAGLLYGSCVMAACRDMSDVRRLMTLLLVVAAGISVFAFFGSDQMQASYGGAVIEGRAVGTFDQPNQLGSFAALAAFVAVGLALSSRELRERAAVLVGLALVAGGMVLSLSRGAWIGSAAAIVFVGAALRQSRRLILWAAIPVLGIAALAGSLASTSRQVEIVSQRIESITILSPYDNRTTIWAEAGREITADPWTGQGPGSFPVASARSASEATTVSADHAHNLWLTWAAESGIPAALLLTGFIISMGSATIQASRATSTRGDRALVIGLAAALVTVIGQGLVDYTLRNAVVYFAVWTVIGALAASWRILRSSPRSTSVDESLLKSRSQLGSASSRDTQASAIDPA